MIRNNGSFRYKHIQEAQKDQATGFYTQPVNADEWIDGCGCQIEKYIPAKQRIGVDGQIQTYNYTVFIPKHWSGNLELTALMEITGEDGSKDEFPIQGVDNFNRKYIEVWG